MIGFLITSCSFSQNKELFITANTNICTNCFGEYQLLDAIGKQTDLRLVFQNNEKKSASKFADKFSISVDHLKSFVTIRFIIGCHTILFLGFIIMKTVN